MRRTQIIGVFAAAAVLIGVGIFIGRQWFTEAQPQSSVSPSLDRSPQRSWPDAKSTGVPAGTSLSDYTGPCTIDIANTVIDAKVVNCDLSIRAAGVTITRSKINGSVANDEESHGYSFTISDSEVDLGQKAGTGLGAADFIALRVHVTGGNRSVHCFRNCTVEDSYVHGQYTDEAGKAHESGIRMGSGATIKHNTIACDAPAVPPDGGCSAGLTGYGDFAPVANNLIENNLFKASTGGFCAYGGSDRGKPFSAQTRGIVYRDNVFERGPTGKCGQYGPIASFDSSRPGNVWSGNTWDDGSVVPPA